MKVEHLVQYQYCMIGVVTTNCTVQIVNIIRPELFKWHACNSYVNGAGLFNNSIMQAGQ